MDAVIRAAVIYIFLLVVFKFTGKRSLAQITTFDFVLLLIISETIQQALLGEDFSIVHAILLVITLMGLEVGLSVIKHRWPKTAKILDGLPTVIMQDGKMLQDRMDALRVDEDDILAAARETQGLERLDQIKYAVVEQSGGISIVPYPQYR